MKDSGPCPKCGARERLEFPSTPQAGLQIGMTIFSAIPVHRRVCPACGFVEDWVTGASSLKTLRDLARKRGSRKG